jgi:hypothetical protein
MRDNVRRERQPEVGDREGCDGGIGSVRYDMAEP